MFSKLLAEIKKRKLLAGLAAILLLIVGYLCYTKFFIANEPVRYVLAQAQKGTLIVSVSGSGQVSASNQVEIKTKASGDVVYVGVKAGQDVKAGALIVQLDAGDAQKAVRDAEVSLESAKISLAKLKKPADTLSVLQAENALVQAKDNLTKLKLSQEIEYQKTVKAKQQADDDLKKAYEDGFNAVSSAFLDLPAVMSGLDEVFFDEGNFSQSQWSNIDWYLNQISDNSQVKAKQYRQDVIEAYDDAREAYTKNFDDYKVASWASSSQTIESLIAETYETAKLISEAIKTANNYVDFVQDDMEQYNKKIPSLVSTHQSKIDSFTASVSGHLSKLLSIQTTIKTSKETIVEAEQDIKEMKQNQPLELSAAEQSIKEKDGSLAKLKTGSDALDIQSAELTIKQRENSLFDAKAKFADYFVRAPFEGTIAELNIKKGDNVSSGATAAILITKQKIAEISLNEVDVAKVKVGQKATLSFDAVPDLTIAGQVAEVDALGAVSQGVVTYTVTIAFDTQDERIKPGMSVSAAIITEVKTDALLVPNASVKAAGGAYYVEIAEGADADKESASGSQNSSGQTGVILQDAPRRAPVEIGAANDESTEILNGLNEGDAVIVRTVQSSSTTAKTNSQQGGIRIPGMGGFR